MPGGQIVVERLSKNVNEDHLFEIFGQFGPIYDLDLPMNRTFGTNRGTAYILYDHHADAEAAIEHMHEAQIDGSTINVSISTQRSKLSPEPPMARRNANMNARAAFHHTSRGRGPPSGPQGGRRYGPRSDVYRPNPLSPGRSRSPRGAPPSRGGAGRRYRSRSRGGGEEGAGQVDMTATMFDAAVGVSVAAVEAGARTAAAATTVHGAIRGVEDGITEDGADDG
ncbi:hypothetical protein A9Z42_0038450 [Trichoderma parareesei]|uniref:RRM domain-containing protein n=1 Tax=Trichoderma parareesei TaxID=858221 RepID=A0A2H2Z749_TRIPA|nr:hypothetical protein A9Z42_0038450 [Trichoderma parareesei]